MTNSTRAENLLSQLEHLNEQQLRRLLVDHLTKRKLGLYWEANAIERDAALNADLVLPRLVKEWSHTPAVRPELVEGGMAGSEFGLVPHCENSYFTCFENAQGLGGSRGFGAAAQPSQAQHGLH